MRATAPVPRTQLLEDGDQGHAEDGVDLVEKEDDGARGAFAPGGEISFEAALRGELGKALQRLGAKLRRELLVGVLVDREEDGVHGTVDVVAGRPGGLAGAQHRGVAARGGELPGQVVEAGRLARLARCVDDEVGLFPDQRFDVW